jgi:hypothetical protein
MKVSLDRFSPLGWRLILAQSVSTTMSRKHRKLEQRSVGSSTAVRPVGRQSSSAPSSWEPLPPSSSASSWDPLPPALPVPETLQQRVSRIGASTASSSGETLPPAEPAPPVSPPDSAETGKMNARGFNSLFQTRSIFVSGV